MSTNTFPVFFDGTLLTTTTQTLYSVPSSPSSSILQEMQIKLTNITNQAQAVSVWAVPSGQGISDSFAIALDTVIAPNSFLLIPTQRLAAGGTIQAIASIADAVNIAPVGGKLHTP